MTTTGERRRASAEEANGRVDAAPCGSRSRSSAHSSSRNNGFPRRSPLSRHVVFYFALIIICCLPLCSATVYIQEQMVEPVEEVTGPPEGSTMDSSASSGRIFADPSPQPASQDWGDWTLESIQELRRRDDPVQLISSSASSPSVTVSEKTQTVTTTVASTTPSPSRGIAPAAATDASSPLPIPFDSGFSSNLTANCASFMNNMLADATFRQCLPISLLLQVSSFYYIPRSVAPSNTYYRTHSHSSKLRHPSFA